MFANNKPSPSAPRRCVAALRLPVRPKNPRIGHIFALFAPIVKGKEQKQTRLHRFGIIADLSEQKGYHTGTYDYHKTSRISPSHVLALRGVCYFLLPRRLRRFLQVSVYYSLVRKKSNEAVAANTVYNNSRRTYSTNTYSPKVVKEERGHFTLHGRLVGVPLEVAVGIIARQKKGAKTNGSRTYCTYNWHHSRCHRLRQRIKRKYQNSAGHQSSETSTGHRLMTGQYQSFWRTQSQGCQGLK